MGQFCYIQNLAYSGFGAFSQGIFGNLMRPFSFFQQPFPFFQQPTINPNNISYPVVGGLFGNSNLNFSPPPMPAINSIWGQNSNVQFNNSAVAPPIFNLNIPTIQPITPAANTGNIGNIGENATLTGTKDLAFWKSQGYDENMGRRLAQDAVSTCRGHADGGCVGYTRRTINRIYGTDFTDAGAAEKFGTNILNSPQLRGKFKKFNINGINGNEVPDGAILIWPHTAYRPGTPAGRYGHGGIASGGKVYSDCVCRDLSKCCEIWIPVRA